jgi:hypothetical protein
MVALAKAARPAFDRHHRRIQNVMRKAFRVAGVVPKMTGSSLK